jgi:hypothetical protein
LRRLGLRTLLLCAFLCRPAQADAYDAALARALAAKERALDTNSPSDWEQALERLFETEAVRKNSVTRYEIGVAASRLREDALAAEAYADALELGLVGSAADKAREFITAHGPALAELEVRGPAGTELFIEQRARGTLPLGRPRLVFPGRSRVRARTPDGRTLELEVSAKAGEHVALDLARGRAAPPPPTRKESHPSLSQPAEESARGPRLGTVLIAGGGALAVAGGATVIVSLLKIDSHRDELAGLCALPDGPDACLATTGADVPAAQSEVDAIASWKAVRTAGFVGLGLGVAVAAGGVVELVTGSTPKSSGWRPGISTARSGLLVTFGTLY